MTISRSVIQIVAAVVRDLPRATISDRLAEARRRGAHTVKRTELRALFATAARVVREEQCPICRQIPDVPGMCVGCAWAEQS